jgi:hypothetical protein
MISSLFFGKTIFYPTMFHRLFNLASKVKKKIAVHPNQVLKIFNVANSSENIPKIIIFYLFFFLEKKKRQIFFFEPAERPPWPNGDGQSYPLRVWGGFGHPLLATWG